MKITTQHLKARKLDMQGFVILPKAVTDPWLTQAQLLTQAVVRQPKPPGKFSFIHYSPMLFTDILADQLVMGLVQFFCGNFARLDNHFGICYPGEGLKPNVHGGPFSEKRSCYYTSQAGIWQTSNLKVAIPLQDQQGTVFVPGSHKTDMPTRQGPTSPHELVAPRLRRGDVLLFTDALVHGTKHVDKPRQMLYYTFTPGHVAWQQYSPPSWLSSVPEDRQRFFRPPGLFQVDQADRTVTQAVEPTLP